MSNETTSGGEAGRASRQGKRRTSVAKDQIARRVPKTVRQGFAAGRARGRACGLEDIAYATAAATGFAFGCAEAAIDALATRMTWLFGSEVGEPAE